MLQQLPLVEVEGDALGASGAVVPGVGVRQPVAAILRGNQEHDDAARLLLRRQRVELVADEIFPSNQHPEPGDLIPHNVERKIERPIRPDRGGPDGWGVQRRGIEIGRIDTPDLERCDLPVASKPENIAHRFRLRIRHAPDLNRPDRRNEQPEPGEVRRYVIQTNEAPLSDEGRSRRRAAPICIEHGPGDVERLLAVARDTSCISDAQRIVPCAVSTWTEKPVSAS